MIFNWITFIVASATLIGVGAFANYRIKKASSGGSEGFLLGAKQVGVFVGAGTLMATGYSGWGFIGSPGTAYAYGTIEIFANFLFAPAIVFGTLIFANFMRKNAEKCGGLTVPEYLASSHKGTAEEKRRVHFLAGLATFIFLSVFMIGQIRAVSLVASQWLGISELMASVIFISVIAVFTIMGGLLAVAITDTLMCIGMLIASLIAIVTIHMHIPIPTLISKVGQMNPELINPSSSVPYGNSIYSVFLVFVYALLFTTTLPYMSVRFLSFKEDIKIHNMALLMAPIGIILSLIPFVGMFMYYQDPNLANPDSAMPVFLNAFMSPIVGGLITLFILFAMMSTISSVLQALASSLSHDLYLTVMNKNPQHGDIVNRSVVGFTAAWVLFLTFVAPQGLLNQIAYIGTGGLISMFVGPIIMRTIVESNLKTCFASMLTGFIANLILVLWLDVGWVEAPILAGLAGSAVYLVMGFLANDGKRKSAVFEPEPNE